MQSIQPLPPRPAQRDSHVSEALATTTHVFVRRDAVRKPLQPPYDGPYSVLERTDKHFTVDINVRKETVSIDCLKPAHLDNDTPNPASSLQLSHHISLLAQDDESISLSTSHHTRRKPLGGSGVVKSTRVVVTQLCIITCTTPSHLHNILELSPPRVCRL
jgi:hypothetical protein